MAQLSFTDASTRPPLDESLYVPKPDELAFFKNITGIKTDDELKQHILQVQAKAYNVHGYPCIRRFTFTRLKVSHLPAYRKALELAHTHSHPIFLDMGCCFGTDLRKAIVDGWPAERCVATDLEQDFWNMGHELFKTSPQSLPVSFVGGDIFDHAVLEPSQPSYATSTPPPNLQTLTSLTPLRGHVSAIHASLFFHLFDEETQLKLAKRTASLLSPEKGSVIFGIHGGMQEKGVRVTHFKDVEYRMFCHSPQSWEELWDGQVFEKGTVKVEAVIRGIEMDDPTLTQEPTWPALVYSITRL
ncbi:hypothetical protein ONZ45_g8455 [Pleurotus djamor]|nr:hypothetical protein ONZ45_g8455 [Pleurotus djamor]